MRGGGELVEQPASNAAATAAGVHLFIGPTPTQVDAVDWSSRVRPVNPLVNEEFTLIHWRCSSLLSGFHAGRFGWSATR
jgi:hypothetical protein